MNGNVVQTNAFRTSKPAGAFATAEPGPTESLAEGIGASYAVIGYRGGKWQLRYKGENHFFTRSDDGTPAPYIDVVILRQAKVKAKSLYVGGFNEEQAAGKRPLCSSIDGIRPDPDAQQQQAALCALCPHNEIKLRANGSKGRDCSDYKRLAVLIMPSQTARMLGSPLLEPAFLRVPPDSLQDLGVFGGNLAEQGWPYFSFITRISFDPEKSHPKFVFNFQQALSDQDAPTILALRDDPIAKRVTGEDEIARRALAPPPTQVQLPPPPAGAPAQTFVAQGVTAGAVNGEPAAVAAPKVLQPPVGSVPPAVNLAPPPAPQQLVTPPQTVTATVIPPPNPPTPSLGEIARAISAQQTVAPPLLELQAAPPTGLSPPQTGAQIGQTLDDVGATIEDSDLDARIANLMKTPA